MSVCSFPPPFLLLLLLLQSVPDNKRAHLEPKISSSKYGLGDSAEYSGGWLGGTREKRPFIPPGSQALKEMRVSAWKEKK